MAEATKISHPEVTNNTGKVERVVDSTMASTTTLQAGMTITAGTTIVTQMLRDEDASTDRAAPAYEFITDLNEIYDFMDDAAVQNFLEANPSLAGLLFQAHKLIQAYFGSEVGTALEVVADPDALGDRQLFVLIQTELPRKEARARLAELDRAWWLDALPASEGKMEIALD